MSNCVPISRRQCYNKKRLYPSKTFEFHGGMFVLGTTQEGDNYFCGNKSMFQANVHQMMFNENITIGGNQINTLMKSLDYKKKVPIELQKKVQKSLNSKSDIYQVTELQKER